MKRKLLLMCFIGFTLASAAQITLTENNTPRSAPHSEPSLDVDLNFALPVEGPNQVYDYHNLTVQNTAQFNYSVPTRSGFTNYTRYNDGYFLLGAFAFNSEYYYEKTSVGYGEVASYKNSQNISLQAMTGHPSDNLDFPGNASVFVEPHYDFKYPATYGDPSWQSNYEYDVLYNVTVNAYGLNNDPGNFLQTVQHTGEIVGWGQLTLPTQNGPSEPYDVLLMKYQTIYTNNYYLNGSPAPQALLDALGVQQGSVQISNSYSFYGEDFEVPMMTILMDDNWANAVAARYSTLNVETLSTNSFDSNVGVKVFPNPSSPNSIVNFTGNFNSEKTDVTVVDVLGRIVYNEKAETKDSQTVQITLPANLTKGVYIYNLKENQSGKSVTGKLIVE